MLKVNTYTDAAGKFSILINDVFVLHLLPHPNFRIWGIEKSWYDGGRILDIGFGPLFLVVYGPY